MKNRSICRSFLAVLLITAILLLTACSALSKAEEQVEEMLAAIAADDLDEAYSLMHQDLSMNQEEFSAAFAGLVSLVDGRTLESYRIQSVSVNQSGSTRTEEAIYVITLEDGAKYEVSYTFCSDQYGTGFTEFSIT